MSFAVMCENLSAQTGNEVGVVKHQCSVTVSLNNMQVSVFSGFEPNIQIQGQTWGSVQSHQSVQRLTFHYDGWTPSEQLTDTFYGQTQ